MTRAILAHYWEVTDMSGKWRKSYVEGNYVSEDGRYLAELRKAGYDAEFGCKLTRHYAIRVRGGSDQIVGTARTLKEAERYL
jgi:hypothetical protein